VSRIEALKFYKPLFCSIDYDSKNPLRTKPIQRKAASQWLATQRQTRWPVYINFEQDVICLTSSLGKTNFLDQIENGDREKLKYLAVSDLALTQGLADDVLRLPALEKLLIAYTMLNVPAALKGQEEKLDRVWKSCDRFLNCCVIRPEMLLLKGWVEITAARHRQAYPESVLVARHGNFVNARKKSLTYWMKVRSSHG